MLLAAATGRVCALGHCAGALGMPRCCWLPAAKSLAGGWLRQFWLVLRCRLLRPRWVAIPTSLAMGLDRRTAGTCQALQAADR